MKNKLHTNDTHKNDTMRIAVIAIQGNVEEHIESAHKAMEDMGIRGEVLPVRHSGTIP